jgi:hypothetical protein
MGVVVGEAAFVQAGYLYAYGANDESHNVYLLRWPVQAVARGDLSAPEWWTATDWAPQATLTVLPLPLFTNGAMELSVQPEPGSEGWLEMQTVGFGAASLDFRCAPSLMGPWGPPSVIYTPPESQRFGVLVYAGKGHPELKGADLVATYVANRTSFAELVNDTSVYYPRFVRITTR